MTRERLLRAVALIVAVLGLIDPAISASRAVHPRVVVVDAAPSEAGDSATTARVRRALSSRFSVADTLIPDAAATVVVGHALPSFARSVGTPAFVLIPNPSPGSAVITGIKAPVSVSYESRAPVSASIRVVGARGRTVEVRASGRGFTSDRVERRVETDDETMEIAFSLIPTTRGLGSVQISAGVSGAGVPLARADVAIEVVERTWSVLFFDLRPSWISTFTRRAIELDPRFVVSSRTATSRGVSAGTPNAPAGLGDTAQLARFDAIVVGAPDALTRDDAGALERYARRRGGSVVLLMERPSSQIGVLSGIASWTESVSADPGAVDVAGGSPKGMLASDVWLPADLPDGARVLARFFTGPGTGTATASGAVTGARPVVLETALGAGRVIASGLVDAWRHRGVPGESAFDTFWRATLASAAEAAPPAIGVEFSSRLLRPGQAAQVRVAIRDEVLADPQVVPGASRVAASLSGAGMRQPVRLWPGPSPGLFVADLRAPLEPGEYRFSVVSSVHSVDVPFQVARDVSAPRPNESGRLSAWASSTGGQAVAESDLSSLSQALEAAVPRERAAGPWRPMRSPWWLLVFGGALCGEWWLRRRRQAR